MSRKTMLIVPAALLAVLPFVASAEGMKQNELDMFKSATLTLNQAGDAALKAHPGTLAGVEFDDENGRAAWQAKVIGSDGQATNVMVDAKTGEVFASTQSSDTEDHEDGAQGQDGETNGG